MLVDPCQGISLIVKIGEDLGLRLDFSLLSRINHAPKDLVFVDLAIKQLSIQEIIVVIKILIHVLKHLLRVSRRLRTLHHITCGKATHIHEIVHRRHPIASRVLKAIRSETLLRFGRYT